MSGKVFAAGNWKRLVGSQRKERMSQADFFSIALPNSKQVWADIGCGPGYFTLPLAERVQKIYAVDISREMLDICNARASDKKISNISVIESDSTEMDLRSDSIDRILLVNVYHEFPAVEKVIREFSRILKSGGRLYVIDWRTLPMESGPPLEHRISEAQVKKEFEAGGFLFDEQHEIYAQNYVLEFHKAE